VFSIEITVILSAFMIAGIVYTSRAAYFFIKSTHNVAIGKELQMQVNPLSIISRSNFNEQGNIYRQQFFKNLAIAIVCLILCFVIGIIFSP